MEVRPLNEILDKYGIEYPHYLQIDTEGYDYEVVKELDLADRPPWAILVEHLHLSLSDKEGMLALLRANGYRVDFCGANDYFAVHRRAPLRSLGKDSARAR